MSRKRRNRGTSSDCGLPTPSDVATDPKAQEILSLWIIDGSPFCLIQVAWNNPAAWGLALADVARMIGNALRDSQGIDPKVALTVLREPDLRKRLESAAFPDLGAMMEGYAQAATELARREFQQNLNYSSESIDSLDEILVRSEEHTS